MAREVAEEGEADVYEEVGAAACDEEDAYGGDWRYINEEREGGDMEEEEGNGGELTEDGDDDEEDGGDGTCHCGCFLFVSR